MAASPIAAALAAALALAPPPGAVPEDMPLPPGPWEPVPFIIPEPAPVPADCPVLHPKTRSPCHGALACRRLLVLGGVAGGLGLGAMITGAALLARPVTVDPRDPTSLVTYRPAGAAFLAVGAGLAVTWLLTFIAARKAGRLARRLQAAPAP